MSFVNSNIQCCFSCFYILCVCKAVICCRVCFLFYYINFTSLFVVCLSFLLFISGCLFGVFLAPSIYKQTTPPKGWPSQTHSTPTSDTGAKSPRHIELKNSSPIPSDAKYSGMPMSAIESIYLTVSEFMFTFLTNLNMICFHTCFCCCCCCCCDYCNRFTFYWCAVLLHLLTCFADITDLIIET